MESDEAPKIELNEGCLFDNVSIYEKYVFKEHISVRYCFTEGTLQIVYREWLPNFCDTHCILKLHPYFWMTILNVVLGVEEVQSHQFK